MKVVLKQNVKNIGSIGDIKEVADGYARNYLIKNNLAVLATAGAIAESNKKKESELKQIAKEKSKAQETYKKLNNFKIKTKLKFGEGDTAFGSVSSQNISDLLKEKGFAIDIKNISLDSNIKTLGEHKVKINLDFDLHPEISIVVEKE